MTFSNLDNSEISIINSGLTTREESNPVKNIEFVFSAFLPPTIHFTSVYIRNHLTVSTFMQEKSHAGAPQAQEESWLWNAVR